MDIVKLVSILNKMPEKKQKYTILACALDKKGKVLSMKTNDYNCTHPLQKYFAEKVGRSESIYLHAEISSIIAAKNKLVHTLLVARIDSKGNPVLAAPCEICQEAIKAYGIKEIIHT